MFVIKLLEKIICPESVLENYFSAFVTISVSPFTCFNSENKTAIVNSQTKVTLIWFEQKLSWEGISKLIQQFFMNKKM